MVAALGLKKVLEYVGDTEHHDLSDPLKGVALGALVVGVALYLAAHVAVQVAGRARALGRPAGRRRAAPRAVGPLTGCRRSASWLRSPGSWSSSLIVESIVFREPRRKIREELAHH